MLKFTMLLLDPPPACTQIICHCWTCQRKFWPSLVQRNATEKSVLIPITSQLFFQSFAESRKQFMRFSNVPPPCHGVVGHSACVYSKAASQDQIALPLPFRSPLRTLMICEHVNWILVLLFKPWGSNPHFMSNYSNAFITLRAKSCKLLDYQGCNYHTYAWSGFRFRAINETKGDHPFKKNWECHPMNPNHINNSNC